MSGRGRSFKPFEGGEEVPLGVVVDKSTRVYIRNIPQSVIEVDGENAMKAMFESIGPIDHYYLHTAYGRFNGNGMCTYKNPSDAKIAVRTLDNFRCEDGSVITVLPAREHGVLSLEKMFGEDAAKPLRGVDQEGRWTHDLFEKSQEQGEGFRGRERGFRGRGFRGRGFRGRGWRPTTQDGLNAELDNFNAQFVTPESLDADLEAFKKQEELKAEEEVVAHLDPPEINEGNNQES